MRCIATCCLVLLLLGWFACHIELSDATGSAESGTSPHARDDGWRRTADGWEQLHLVESQTEYVAWSPPSFHPLRLAIWQLVLSTLALVAFDRRLWGSDSMVAENNK